MIAAVALLAAYGVSILWVGRELGKARPREGRLMADVSLMIALSVLAGGALTGGGMP